MLSIHVGSLSKVSQDTLKTQDPLSIVTMLKSTMVKSQKK